MANEKHVSSQDVYNMPAWVEDNKSSFKPPVCNQLMYGKGQLKVMFVGGPNSRKDYHIEEGEELFYMLKGDMCLKIKERGQPKDIIIKEGQVFVLPSRIPHSPQRMENTIGLVIERERLGEESDGLRYYCEDGVTVLFEKWFRCSDLVKDLPPIIKEYMQSDQFKTGKPIPGTISETPPVKIDTTTEVDQPFGLADWIDNNKKEIQSSGTKELFSKGEFEVTAYGGGRFDHENQGETFLWQIDGECLLKLDSEQRKLQAGDVTLVPAWKKFTIERQHNSIGLTMNMDPLAAKNI